MRILKICKMIILNIACFSGVAFAAQSRVAVDNPRGGEVYIVGQSQVIHISSRLSTVDVFLSRDGAQTFEKLGTINSRAADVSKRTTLNWTITEPVSNSCVIYVSNGKYSATSGMFAIVKSPAAGTGNGTTGSVSTEQLVDGAVTTPKLADGAVTSVKISSGQASSQMVLTADGIGGVNWLSLPSVSSFDPTMGSDVVVAINNSATKGSINVSRLDPLVVVKNTANTFTTGTQTIQTGADTTIGFIVKGNSGTQSADLQQWRDSSNATVAAVSATGVLTANGSSLTNLNASNLATGTVPAARLGSGTTDATTVLRGDGTWAVPAVVADLTNLNATNLTSGTLPAARFPATLPVASGVNLTNLNGTNIATGTVPAARLGSGTTDASTVLRGDGTWAVPAVADLTNLNGSNIVTGTVPAARLGSGTTDASTVLRGDGTWAVPAVADLTNLNATNLTSGTLPAARFPATLPVASGVNLTNLNGTNIATGTVPAARLGSGTTDASTVLRGDGTWAASVADLTPAVVLAPAASARNVVQPTGSSVVPLSIKGAASQSANLQEWQDSTATLLASVSNTGAIMAASFTGPLTGSVTGNATNVTGTVAVANGGTGSTTLASGSYLLGNGTGALAVKTPAQVKTDLSLVKGDVGLGSVENTALSTWAGTTNLTTLGTITFGTWNGTTIGVANGGTGSTTLASGSYLLGNGTGALAVKTPAQVKMDLSLVKADVGLGNVENTALSTWAGTTNLTTLGTITSGTWNGTTIGVANGGTGSTSLGTSKQPLLGNGTSAVTAATAPTVNDVLADAILGTSATTQKGLVIQGVASQTANLQEWQDSTAAVKASVSVSGVITAAGFSGNATNVTGTVAVANGGTNSTTALNDNRIMVSSGGKIVEAGALTNGQVLVGSTGAAPTAAALTAGSGISITNGAGSISIATTGAAPTGSAGGDLTNTYPNPTLNTAQISTGNNIVTALGVADTGTIPDARLTSNIPHKDTANTFTGLQTLSAANQALTLSGAPTNSATQSLVQVGNAIAGGNSAANGGTWLGINTTVASAGVTADFLNFQNSDTTKFKVDSTGAVTATSFAGALSGNVTPTGFTQGSVTFAGASGVLSQDNAKFFWDDTNFRLGLGSALPSTSLSFSGQAAQTIGVERHASTVGSSLTVQAGGALSGGTDLSGGNLVLSGGISTGTGAASILLQPTAAGSTGTSDNAPATKVTVSSTNTQYTHQYFSLRHDNGASGAIDFKNGNTQVITLTAATAITLANAQAGARYLLEITQDGTGSRTVTWPANVHFGGGTLPTLTTTAGYTDIVTLYYNGTNFIAAAAYNFAP